MPLFTDYIKDELGTTCGSLLDPMTVLDLPIGINPADQAVARKGMVGSIDPSTGNYALGIGSSNRPPLFLYSSPTEGTVSNIQGNPATDNWSMVSVVPPAGTAGKLRVVHYKNPVELTSTAFDPADASALNVPDTPLMSPSSGASRGLLKPWTSGNTIVGYVSQGIKTEPQLRASTFLCFHAEFHRA